MIIVTWNCNGALRKKTKELDALDADILIVQECEDPSISTKDYREWAGDYLWLGKSKNKGIGVFAKKGHSLTAQHWSGSYKINGIVSSHPALSWKTQDLELFLPCTINNKINLLAVWTKDAESKSFAYIGQLWKLIQIHKKLLERPQTIIIGDFNSNKIWDEPDSWWSHSAVVAELQQMAIASLYHHQFVEHQGQESTATFYMNRKPEKAYHIDYVFLSSDLLDKSSLLLGDPNDWLSVSDHVPLISKIDS